MKTKFALVLLFGALWTGCDSAEESAPVEIAEEDVGSADIVGLGKTVVDPLRMPKKIMDFETQHQWGKHHVAWHTARRWNLLSESSQKWAERQGWRRATLQEGQAGNGLEFLAMHRAMLRILKSRFTSSHALFTGWTTPPTDPRDQKDPLPGGDTSAFDANMRMTLEKLASDDILKSFSSDDELGRYIETSLRPTASNPRKASPDKTTGIHNYLHVRFSDENSSIDIGDPTVNLGNKRFWRIHGWIDSVWTRYRTLKGFTEEDPMYKNAVDAATAMMLAPPAFAGTRDPAPMPAEIRHIFAVR